MRAPRVWLLLLLPLLPMTGWAESTADLLRIAQQAYMRGDIEAAKSTFEMVVQIDPRNPTALTYLRTIRAAKPAISAAKSQQKQLNGVILAKVQFNQTSFGSALEYLKQQVAKSTEGKVPLNFVTQVPEETLATPITLALSNVPVGEILRYLGELAKVSITYEPFAVAIRPLAPKAAAGPVPATLPPN